MVAPLEDQLQSLEIHLLNEPQSAPFPSWCNAACQHLEAACSQLPWCPLSLLSLLSLLPGITKTHNLHFQDSEALQVVFSSHLCPNVLKAPARCAASTRFFLADKNLQEPPPHCPSGLQNLVLLQGIRSDS